MVEMELNEGSRVIRRAYCVLVLGHVTARFQRDGRLWGVLPRLEAHHIISLQAHDTNSLSRTAFVIGRAELI
jgi:hypothetical protein